MDDPALMIGFTILVWCRDSGLVPCWLLHAVSPVTLSFASAASRDATRGGIIGVYFQYKKRLFSIQHIIMYHYHDAMVQNRRGYYPVSAPARGSSRFSRAAPGCRALERSSRSRASIMHKNHRLSPDVGQSQWITCYGEEPSTRDPPTPDSTLSRARASLRHDFLAPFTRSSMPLFRQPRDGVANVPVPHRRGGWSNRQPPCATRAGRRSGRRGDPVDAPFILILVTSISLEVYDVASHWRCKL